MPGGLPSSCQSNKPNIPKAHWHDTVPVLAKMLALKHGHWTMSGWGMLWTQQKCSFLVRTLTHSMCVLVQPVCNDSTPAFGIHGSHQQSASAQAQWQPQCGPPLGQAPPTIKRSGDTCRPATSVCQ